MRTLDCTICGYKIDNEYDHEACNTLDAMECHDTEYEHFAELDYKMNNMTDDNLLNL